MCKKVHFIQDIIAADTKTFYIKHIVFSKMLLQQAKQFFEENVHINAHCLCE